MGKRLFVGNLPYAVTDEKLQEIFEGDWTVENAYVIIDRHTGRSKGFGFVEMSTDQEAQTAIEKMDGQEVDGRKIVVNEAKPMRERNSSFRGGRSRGFGNSY